MGWPRYRPDGSRLLDNPQLDALAVHLTAFVVDTLDVLPVAVASDDLWILPVFIEEEN